MRKLIAIIIISCTAFAVSCTREQEFSSSDGPVRVSYTIDGLAQMATKTMGTIGSSYTLYYEVRLWDGSALGDALIGDGLSGSKTVGASDWPATVSFELARGKQYKILFWAQIASDPSDPSVPSGLFNATDLTAVAIDYSKMAANNENCDAFFGSDVITPSGATAASVTLQRPFALVNLGTSDASKYKTASGGSEVGNISAKISGDIATVFNVAEGAAGTALSGSFTAAAAPIDSYSASTLSVGESSFNYLSAVYVLPLGSSSNIEVEYTIKDNQGTPADITSLTVSNVPVKTNYRTNITGKLLTGSTIYNITVDQAFGGNTVKAVCPTFASVDDLNDYFETMADNSDHGDINPEEVILTSIADDETIVLPAIAGGVLIRVPATLVLGTLNIAYATEGDKPAYVSLYVSQLEKLVANITSSHFTLLDGSWITDTAEVYTSASTFVIEEGARVGTVEIKQGNASISGTVATVSVHSDATADGTGAVQVFLNKVSAVNEIVLNAKSDVVVEQPKDQIDVVATEKKVAVYVNAGAENSTAKAQNGGVIYVQANVPCTVTADGVSTADEGTVSSTVIINSGAAASEVVATNGGAINLTANADCEVTSTGTSEETATPSSVTVAKVDTGAEVSAVTSQGGQVNVSTGVDKDAVDVREGVAFANCIVYTPGVEASVKNDNIVFSRVKVNAAESTFANAIANSTSGQVIELTKNIDFSGQTITIAGGVAIDFAGYTLSADKVIGNNGKVLFKQSKKYNSVYEAAAEVAQGYLSYVGAIENVEIWGGTYAFDPQGYTPAGIALVADGAEYELSGKWFVPAIPEAVVYHGTQQEMEDNNISFVPSIWPIELNGDGVLINWSNPVYNLTLPVQNGAYAFLSDDDESPLTSDVYRNWIADFIVSIDQDTNIAGIIEEEYNTQYPIPSWGIWGAYSGMQFAPALCFNLTANERFPLLGSMGMGWNYNAMRNTVHTFICGAVNVHPDNEGKVVTAELCIAPPKFSSMAKAIEADEFIVVGKYSYTMEEPYYDITQLIN